MIHEVGNGFVISSHGGWIPGSYVDRKAARYAFQFNDSDLQKLQDRISPSAITTADLKNLRKELIK